MTDQPTGSAEPAPARAPDPHKADMRDILAVCSTLIFVAMAGLHYALAWSVPMLDQGLATQLNQFDTAALVQWAGVMGYYFGSSRDMKA
jgi:hypothetical protein